MGMCSHTLRSRAITERESGVLIRHQPFPRLVLPSSTFTLATLTHAQPRNFIHACPFPVKRDVGSPFTHNRGTGGSNTRGKQEVVGPPGASRQPTLYPTTSLVCKSETEVAFYRAP